MFINQKVDLKLKRQVELFKRQSPYRFFGLMFSKNIFIGFVFGRKAFNKKDK